jgi:hypothetical protein
VGHHQSTKLISRQPPPMYIRMAWNSAVEV